MKALEPHEAKAERPKEVVEDETPSGVTDHAFSPKGLWYTLCSKCNLAESAHTTTTVDHKVEIRYYSDDNPEE